MVTNNKFTTCLGSLLLLVNLLIPLDVYANSISKFTQGMKKHSGFFNFYWDQKKGKIWLEISEFDKEFLYVNFLETGIGSNDLGFDRGKLGPEKIVYFKKVGPKVLLVQPNLYYRAFTNNKAEQNSIEESFAQSVLWGFITQAHHGKSVLIDLSEFLLADTHQLSTRLSNLKEGSYSIDQSRSAIYLPNTRSFPKNSEFESLITYTGTHPGKHISSVVPTPEHITIHTRHSFIELPDNNYQAREFDPRSGAIAISYMDYTAPLNERMEKKMVIRHRLKKKFPEKPISDPVKPIIYYLDPGTPEPVRSALLEGARWWTDAFKAIGFSNAFKVELLPQKADMLDIRYNTIQWVHRSTRGWSYGSSIVNPKTGEILKGHVSLGSLRVRQDMLIAQGLLAPFKNGDETPNIIQDMALARIRQLSAHEVGHTLGFAHNFYASVNNRASVMDYPHPLVKINTAGEIDLQDAYSTGIGDWDKISLAYSYSEFSDSQSERNELKAIIKTAQQRDLYFISDADARPTGGSHPYAHLWDNGNNPIQSLKNVLAVRQKALQNFNEHVIPIDTELFYLEHIFVPVYLFHRYQTEAVVKLIGGVDYQYSLRGGLGDKNKIVVGKTQQAALEILIKTLQANQLAIPETILELLTPPPSGSYRQREHFKNRTGVNFDALGAVEAAARQTASLIFHPHRANRIVEQSARHANISGLSDIIDKIYSGTWKKKWENRYYNEVQNSINWSVLTELMKLGINPDASPQTRAIVIDKLEQLKSWLKNNKQYSNQENASRQAIRDIRRYIEHESTPDKLTPLSIPPGSPIGSD